MRVSMIISIPHYEKKGSTPRFFLEFLRSYLTVPRYRGPPLFLPTHPLSHRQICVLFLLILSSPYLSCALTSSIPSHPIPFAKQRGSNRANSATTVHVSLHASLDTAFINLHNITLSTYRRFYRNQYPIPILSLRTSHLSLPVHMLRCFAS